MMNIILFKIFVFLLVVSLTMTGLINMAQAEKLDLSQYQWDHRLLLLFAPNQSDSQLEKQIKTLRQSACDVNDRDMLVIQFVKGPNALTLNGRILPFDENKIRTAYRTDDNNFTVILIGKDGGEKMRSQEIIAVHDIFDEIDTMPMRQDEMESRTTLCG